MIPFEHNVKSRIALTEKAIRELEARLGAAKLQTSKIYEGLKRTPEELRAYLNSPELMTPSQRESLAAQKSKLDETLKDNQSNLRDLRETENTYKELHEARNWILVR